MHLLPRHVKTLHRKAIAILGSFVLLLLSTINVQAYAPIVDLGADTVSCGNPIILDAGNAGATFNWSTGEVSQTITVSTSGTYWVDVIDGSGTSRDSIEVTIFSNLPMPAVNDTSVCQLEEGSLSVAEMGDGVLWYDSLTGGNVLGSDATISFSFESTSTIYPEYFHFVPDQIGMPDTSFGTISYIRSSGNGEIFDIGSLVKINAVYTYSDGPVSFDLVIQDKDNTVLYTKAVSINTSFLRTRIPIGITLPKGESYKMTANNISGTGGLALSFPSSLRHPYSLDNHITLKSGVNVSPLSRFYFFYDWEVEIPGCSGPRNSVQISVLPTPVIDLGRDTIICNGVGSTFVLDASNAGASYLWQDGSTNPTFTPFETDTISVISNIGTCIASGEIAVYFYEPPAISELTDTVLCGPQEFELSGSQTPPSEYVFWRNSTGDLLTVDSVYRDFIQDTTILEIQHVNSRGFSLGPKDLSISNLVRNDGLDTRGIQVNAFQDILIRSLAVFPVGLQTLTFDIVVLDSNRVEINRYPQSVSPPFSKETLIVNIFLPKGNRYTLEVQNRVGGNVLRNALQENIFPFVLEGIASIPAATSSSNVVTGQYNYLYDLEVVPYSTACRSTPKEIQVNVNLPLNLTDSLYSCESLIFSSNVTAQNYVWSTGAQTASIPIDTTGMYVLTVNDGANCSVTDSTFVEIPIGAGLPADGILCGDLLETNYGAESIFTWSTGANTPTINVTATGSYSVIVQEPRGCVLTDTINVSGFDDVPTVNLGSDQSVCESLTLDAGNPGFTYLWSTGETTQQITITSSGLYTVLVSNQNNCTAEDTVGVLITPLPESQFSIADTVIGGVSRRATFVNQSSFGSYFWDFGDGNTSTAISPTHSYADTGTYCVKLVTTDLQNNCGTDTAEKCIVVLQYPLSIEEEILGTDLLLYPNPASEMLILEVKELIQADLSLSILDLKGQLILQKDWIHNSLEKKTVLDVSSLSSGIYILKIERDGRSLHRKISVQ